MTMTMTMTMAVRIVLVRCAHFRSKAPNAPSRKAPGKLPAIQGHFGTLSATDLRPKRA
jgi:hypothetical protein